MIFLKDNEAAAKFAREIRRLERLPTLETQLIQAFRIIGMLGDNFDPAYTGAFDLRRGRFHAYVRTDFWRLNETPLWVLTLGAVEIPPPYWGRGWFRNFSEIVYDTMPHNALVLENVMNEAVYAAFSKKPDYIPFKHNSFLRSTLVKRGDLDNSTLLPRITRNSSICMASYPHPNSVRKLPSFMGIAAAKSAGRNAGAGKRKPENSFKVASSSPKTACWARSGSEKPVQLTYGTQGSKRCSNSRGNCSSTTGKR